MQQVHACCIAFDIHRFMVDFLGRKKLFRAQAARSPGAPEDANGFVRHCFLTRLGQGKYSGLTGLGKSIREPDVKINVLFVFPFVFSI
jgi:hypothetical protein